MNWALEYESFLNPLLEQSQAPGMAVGVSRGGKPVYLRGFGDRDLAAGLPMTVDTVMGVASCTKIVTAIAVLLLQEQGKLSVHDSVQRYLPEFRLPAPGQAGQISLHHLLTHTSGLPALAPVRIREARPQLIQSEEDLLALLAERGGPLLGEPGSCFSYSNLGYALLGSVVARVSGIDFRQFVDERILGPAGMERSTMQPARLAQLGEVAVPYRLGAGEDGRPGPVAPVPPEGPMVPAGALHSTVRDMLHLLSQLQADGSAILSPASRKALREPYVEVEPGHFYGYGLLITPKYHGVTLAGHNGTFVGMAAHFLCVPERNLVGVGMSSMPGAPQSQAVLSAINAELGLSLATERFVYEEAPIDPACLSAYVGEYANGEGSQVSVTAADGRLQIVNTDEPPCLAVPVGPHRFVLRLANGNAHYQFHPDDQGRVHSLSTGLRRVPRVQ